MPVNNQSQTGVQERVKCSNVTRMNKCTAAMFSIALRISDLNGATIVRTVKKDGVLQCSALFCLS